MTCPWPRNPLDLAYHDTEWGVPQHDDRAWFECITLEGAQAGLSWSTVLAKRDGYRRLFADWDVARVARFTDDDVARIVLDPGVVRHRGKITSTVSNAAAFLAVQAEFGSFDAYVWRFVRGVPIDGRRAGFGDIPSRSPESDALSKDLKARGFKFVGTTICYALMQATGMVNDHLLTCPRHAAVGVPPGASRAAPLSAGSA